MIKQYLNFLIPQTIEEIQSSLSGNIKVIKLFNKPRIIVNDMIQSGGLVELIWKKGIKKVQKFKSLKVQNVLILGLGGGTVTNLINQSFPQAKITGIEIDPAVIRLGKKHFGLGKIKNLKIIQADAVKYVNDYSLITNRYSLILVDLYIGDKVPKKAEAKEFLKNLKKLISKNGIIIFNRLFYQDHKKKTEEFIKKLDKYFPKIELIRIWSNLLVVCRK